MVLRSLLLVLAGLVLAGCGGNQSEVKPPAAATAHAGPIPDLSGTGLDGEALSLADFAGKPVFVNVWSSW